MLYANTDDGSSALWVCDGNGIVVDNISIYGAERAPILEQINEHYGTSFTGWSDNEMSLRFGDPIPNWNAYEKILLPIVTNVKFKASDIYYIGKIEQSKCYIYGDGDTKFAVVDAQGYYRALGNDVQGLFNNLLKPALVREGYDVNSYEDIILDLPLNSEVPNFAEMVEISL